MRTSNSVSPARRAAFEILMRVEEGAYASVLLNSRANQLNKLDRHLCHELVMGTLRRQLWLDRLGELFSQRKSSDLDAAVRIILRLGLYQLRFLSRIPDSAIVNESVNLVKLARLRSAGGLVNAVLRRATREREADPVAKIDDPLERIAVDTSHPRWLIERWTRALGVEEAERFARANNDAAPTAFRVVKTRAIEAEVINRLESAGGTIEASHVSPSAWRLSGASELLSQFVTEGQVYIQDEASQLISSMVGPRAGEWVLDLCAAPGSKTTQMADQSGGQAKIVAADLHEHRLRTLVDSSRLQSLENIYPVQLDALQQLPFHHGSFDRVLVDAPCTGTGTLRRNPEIRWRISPDDIADLASRQKRILQHASKVVKPGGRLIYSTCSVELEENEAVRADFLDGNPEFKPLPLHLTDSLSTDFGTARTWPQRHGTDGFFVSAFERITA